MQLARCPRIAAPVYSRVWLDVIREGHYDHAVTILKKMACVFARECAILKFQSCVRSWFYQWHTNIVQGSTNGTTNGTIGKGR